SFARERELNRDQPTRALCFLFSEIIKDLSGPERSDWYRSPFLFRAVKISIAKLLDALEPKGEMRLPPKIAARMEEHNKIEVSIEEHKTRHRRDIRDFGAHLAKKYKSPQSAGSQAAQNALRWLSQPPSEYEIGTGAPHWIIDLVNDRRRMEYGMADVRRDL